MLRTRQQDIGNRRQLGCAGGRHMVRTKQLEALVTLLSEISAGGVESASANSKGVPIY